MSRAKWFVGIMLILVLASLTLALTGRKSVRAELVIAASPASIWSVLMDTSSYRDWNPIFVSAQGVFKEGGTISYQMKIGESPAVGVEPSVRKLEAEREINQFGGLGGVLTYNHTWRLEPMGESTKVSQHEEYRGLYVWFWDPSPVERVYTEALVALQARLDAQQREQGQ